MAYGMSAAKEAGLGGTQVWKRLMGMPVDQLKAAAKGEVPGVDMNMATLALRAKMTGVAEQGVKAQQQLAGGQGTVKDRIMAKADLPEMLGIGRLPAQNMEEMAYAEGGVVGYADGGVPEGYELYEDPTTGEVYQRKIGAGVGPAIGRGVSALGGWLDRATTPGYKKTPEWYAQNAPVAPTAAPVAAPAAVAQEAVKAPAPVKKAVANVAQPKMPVEDPTPAQKTNLDRTIADTEKLYDFIDKKFGSQLDPVKQQLERDREEYKNMKSENVGLALLGAAGALLKPGRSTASAIGEGLGTLAEYGTKFQPQMLAARQGISAGEIGLAQAQAQASRGNFSTAAQMVGQDESRALQERELAAKEKLYGAQAQYYGARASDTGGGGAGAGLSNLKALQGNLQAQLKGLQGKVDPQSVAMAKQLQMQLQQVGDAIAQRSGISLNTGFVAKPGAGMNVTRSSLFEE
jgi:hypothetical protein